MTSDEPRELVVGSIYASDQPREDMLIRGIPSRTADVLAAVLAEVARFQATGVCRDWKDDEYEFQINVAAEAIAEAIRLKAGGAT